MGYVLLSRYTRCIDGEVGDKEILIRVFGVVKGYIIANENIIGDIFTWSKD